MENLDMSELNKKVAEWCGIFWGWADNPETMRNEDGWYVKMSDESCRQVELPDFPNDLNACFEYIVPKLGYREILFRYLLIKFTHV